MSTKSGSDRIGPDWTGSDQGLDLAPDHGLNHGPDHGSNHGSWIGPCKIKFLCDKPKQSVCDKIEGGPLWEFFFAPNPPVVTFTAVSRSVE